MFDILQSFYRIALELTVLFIGVSFLINLFQGLIPYKKIEAILENSPSYISALFAVLFAFITPFCSCSTIPIVVNLLRNHVRFSIVMIFLFASPVLDLTILTLMTYLLGWKVSVIYTLTTTFLSILIGFSLHALGFESQLKNVYVEHTSQSPEKKFDLRFAVKETFSLMRSVYPYLIIGAGIGAVIHGVVPADWIAQYLGGDTWWLVPIAAIIGIPLYIRLSTMIPISHMLMAKGMALGPMMALMISSAGASLPEITLLHSIFKKKLVVAFIVSVLSMSSISGLLFYFI
ncbi:permease [Halobacillus locisalis]|uniref:Permease n=2 Tax=Halobacillus locisalis TaxID=220753 RepID=A0A838CX03_9BACI|nr:permease [Halobacillus locisalis]MBA2176577.1 permease [Halobacillus locisalis]